MITRRFAALRRSALVLGALASSLTLTTPVSAQGDLLIAPTRVILDGRRGTEIILSNIGDEEATYRISLELRRMTAEGALVDVELENANSAEEAALEMIRYAPRRITLPPGQPQAVRVAARPGAAARVGRPLGGPPVERRLGVVFAGVCHGRPANNDVAVRVLR